MSSGPGQGRDRRVYTRAHPVLFGLLAVTRRWDVRRVGGTVLVHGSEAYRGALTRLPLDRAAAGTTGGSVRRLAGGGGLFDQDGAGHRGARRQVADLLGAAAVERLRPVWREVLDRRVAELGAGRAVDVVPLAREMAGATVCALLGTSVPPDALAEAAGRAAAAAVRAELPGPRRLFAARAAATAADRLTALLAADASDGDGADAYAADAGGARAMLAVAGVNTTVAALPRAVAWCADAGWWQAAGDPALRPALVSELLRAAAPSPVLPRVAAADGELGGCPVRRGDRLVLVARHAAQAHRTPPDPHDPAPAALAQLVFGAGHHACPGAHLARAQLADLLAALAPYRPEVTRARADRGAALPGWRTLVVRAGVTA